MTYYVVAQQVGLIDIDILYQSAIDFMLEPILFSLYLLCILYVCYLNLLFYNNIDGIKYFIKYLNIHSQNNILLIILRYINMKSADNLTLYFKDHLFKWLGVSETKRQLFYLLKHIINVINNYIINFILLTNIGSLLTDFNSRLLLILKKIIDIQKITDKNFWEYLAGVIDGDGNFDLRTLNGELRLKAIRIKLHNRDLRILTYIQNKLHIGRIRKVNNKLYSLYVVSTISEMSYIINNINGLIRLKNDSFIKACDWLQIKLIKLNYTILELSLYLAGLIDTDGSIVFNYLSNRIECVLEVKQSLNSEQLNLDYVILNCKLSVMFRTKHNQTYEISNNNIDLLNKKKTFYSISFKYQNVSSMMYIYDYFMINRLYSDMKFYRISKIKYFLEIRKYHNYLKDSIEYSIYKSFLLDFIKYSNLLWYKVLFVSKL